MSIELTKDTDKALCMMYKMFLDSRKSGESRRKSKDFSSQERWDIVFAEQSREDAADILRELKRIGFVHIYLDLKFVLEDSAIIYMENRFPRGVADVLDWLGKIKAAIPFM
jgi:hypothetical protein